MGRTGRILVVDDEVNTRAALTELLRREGFDVETAADAFKALGIYEAFSPHVVLTDLKMPGMDGLELVKKLRAKGDDCDLIVMTGAGAVETAVEAMHAGASTYLTKPVNFDELVLLLDRSLEISKVRRENRQLRARVRDWIAPGKMIGDAPVMQRVFEVIEQVAQSKATVLISGESGTGKELVANAIHEKSQRANAPFIKLHCTALAESMGESELFGHEKGAVPGAATRKDGALMAANGGTLFLDEIGELSPGTQIKLLGFLQDHEYQRVGGTQTLKADVRIIAATNKSLKEEISRGRFREDLFYRLNVVSLEMPALRERKSDIQALARQFLDRFAKDNNKAIGTIAPEAMDLLMAYDWPGNVRELENAIERAVVLTTGKALEARALPTSVRPSLMPAGSPPIPGSTMSELERFAILETLKSTGGSTSKAADILGISTRTIQYRLHEYNEARRPSEASKNAGDKA